MNIGYWSCETCGGCTDHYEADDDDRPSCNHCGDDLFAREYTPMPPAVAAGSPTQASRKTMTELLHAAANGSWTAVACVAVIAAAGVAFYWVMFRD